MMENTTRTDEVIMEERKRWGFFGIPWTFTKYTLKPKKLLLSKGLLTSTEQEILLYRVVDISYSRTLTQKMFGLGTVTVYSHDKTTPTLEIKNIKHSREFREELSDAIERDRLRMKMRQSELIDVDAGDYGEFDNDDTF